MHATYAHVFLCLQRSFYTGGWLRQDEVVQQKWMRHLLAVNGWINPFIVCCSPTYYAVYDFSHIIYICVLLISQMYMTCRYETHCVAVLSILQRICGCPGNWCIAIRAIFHADARKIMKKLLAEMPNSTYLSVLWRAMWRSLTVFVRLLSLFDWVAFDSYPWYLCQYSFNIFNFKCAQCCFCDSIFIVDTNTVFTTLPRQWIEIKRKSSCNDTAFNWAVPLDASVGKHQVRWTSL